MLLLVSTGRGSEAALLTPFINTTHMCAELFYNLFGSDASVDVELVREDQVKIQLNKVF